MADKLGEYFIQFSQAGAESVKAAMEEIQRQLLQVQNGMEKASQVFTAAFARITSVMSLASISLTGLAAAGLATSAAGQVLAFQFQQLSRIIAGLFGPEIQKVINLVSDLVQWFRRLSEEQRSLIAHFVMGSIAALAVAKTMPMLFAGIMTVVGGIQAVIVAMIELNITTGGVLSIIGFLVTGLSALGAGTKVGRDGILGLFQSIRPLIELFGTFAAAVLESAKPLLDMASVVFGALVQALSAVMPMIVEAVGIIGSALSQAIATILPAVVEFAVAFGKLAVAAAELLKLLAEIFGSLLKAAAPIISAIIQIVTVAIDVIKAWADIIKIFATAAVPIFKAIGDLVAAVGNVFGEVFKTIAAVIQAVVGVAGELGGVFEKFATIVAAFVVGAIQHLVRFLQMLERSIRALRILLGLQGVRQSPTVRGQAARPGGNRSELSPQIGGSEGLDAAWWRIAQASIMATAGARSHEQTVEESLREIAGNTATSSEVMRRLQPAIG